MVSCRCGYQTLISLLFGKGTDLIIGTTDLVSAGHLHIFGLQINLVSGLL